jgi:2'-5' RNA ligase
MLTKSIQQPPAITTVRNWLNDYGVWEYLLIVSPDKTVTEKLCEEKQKFTSNYKEFMSVETQPHISIAVFLAKEQMEETLNRWIQSICNTHSRFPVLLHNFSGFVPHTIYLQVQNPEPFKQLAKSMKSLDHFIRASECPPLKLTTIPHLTIARRLSEETYFKALPQYLHRTFQQSFIATELTLIRRATSNGSCVTVHRFPLAPEQPTLFN